MKGAPASSMEDDILSNLTSASGEQAASASSSGVARSDNVGGGCNNQGTATPPPKKKRSGLPCNPGGDPDAEVVALSPKSLAGTDRFMCEVCNKGFKREQNLQLHRRGHNLPWNLKQRRKDEPVRRKVYVCPEPTCMHHDPSCALGDLTGIKKHFFRKHGEKLWKCDKCEKKYAVRSDCKAHSKVCGTREYKCDCETVFSRRDSFITHRAFCDALTQETMMKSFPPSPLPATTTSLSNTNTFFSPPPPPPPASSSSSYLFPQLPPFNLPNHFLDNSHGFHPLPLPLIKPEPEQLRLPMAVCGQQQDPQHPFCSPCPSSSATALLQKATMMGAITTSNLSSLASRSHAAKESILLQDINMNMTATMMMSSISPDAGIDGIQDPKGGGDGQGMTRDFLSLSRGFPLPPPPPRKDLVRMHGDDISVHIQEEEGNNDDHQACFGMVDF